MKTSAALVLLGMVLCASSVGAQEADLSNLRAAAKSSPKEASAALAYGKALRRAGHLPEAVSELERGALLGTALKAGLAEQLRYELARTKIDQRDASGALRACDGLGKATAISNACRAEAFLLQNRATEALPLVEKALASDSSLYEAKVAEGRALGLENKSTEAEAAFRAAIGTSDTRPEAHRWLGDLLLNDGKRDAGVAELRKAASSDSSDATIQFALGQALGMTKDARDAFSKAVKIRPSYAVAQAELAHVATELGELSTAETAANEAVKLDGSLFVAHLALARVRLAQSKWDDAMKEGEAAKKLLPNASQAVLVVADAQAGKGDIDLAVASYQTAFGLDKTDPAPLVRAARACIAASRPTTARGFADRVTSEFPKWGPGWVALAEVAEKQGDKAKAKTALEEALKSEGPVDKEAVKKKIESLR